MDVGSPIGLRPTPCDHLEHRLDLIRLLDEGPGTTLSRPVGFPVGGIIAGGTTKLKASDGFLVGAYSVGSEPGGIA